MPPLGSANKSKNKHKDARHSRSRNTTPSSVLSATVTATAPSTTPFLLLDTSKLLVSPQPSYAEILDRLETKPSNLEPKQLQDIIDQLKQLSDAAEKRVDSCEKAIRVIHDQLKDLDSEHKERERQVEQVRRHKAKKEETSSQKNLKAKKRKDREGADVEIKREGEPPFEVTNCDTGLRIQAHHNHFARITILLSYISHKIEFMRMPEKSLTHKLRR